MSKINSIRKELHQLPINDLRQKVEALRRELFSLRLHTVTSPIKDYKQFIRMKRDIARVLTFLNQKETEPRK
jgi:ribosomal protein L29